MSLLCRVLTRKPFAPSPAHSLSRWTDLVRGRLPAKSHSRRISHRSLPQSNLDETAVTVPCSDYQDVILVSRIKTFLETREALEEDLKDRNLAPLLGMAIEMEKVDVVRWLLERGVDPSGWSYGRCISHLAHATSLLAYNMTDDNRKIFDMLLRYGARVQGSGALWEAAELGDIAAVGALLDKGADVNEIISLDTFACQDGGEDPFRQAQLKKFIDKTASGTALHAAAVNEHVEIAGFLLYKGADRTILDSREDTAGELANLATFEDEELKETDPRYKMVAMLYYTPE